MAGDGDKFFNISGGWQWKNTVNAGCAVVISHDRWFLDRICTHILAFEGNISEVQKKRG